MLEANKSKVDEESIQEKGLVVRKIRKGIALNEAGIPETAVAGE